MTANIAICVRADHSQTFSSILRPCLRADQPRYTQAGAETQAAMPSNRMNFQYETPVRPATKYVTARNPGTNRAAMMNFGPCFWNASIVDYTTLFRSPAADQLTA